MHFRFLHSQKRKKRNWKTSALAVRQERRRKLRTILNFGLFSGKRGIKGEDTFKFQTFVSSPGQREGSKKKTL